MATLCLCPKILRQRSLPRTKEPAQVPHIHLVCLPLRIGVGPKTFPWPQFCKLLDSGFRSITDLQLLIADKMPRLERPLADVLRLRQGLRNIPGRCPPPIGTPRRPSQDPPASVPTTDAPVLLDTLLQTLQQPLGCPTPSPSCSVLECSALTVVQRSAWW